MVGHTGVIVTLLDPEQPLASVTVSVKVAGVRLVAVPLSTPVLLSKLSQVGSPEAPKVNGDALEPVTAMAWLYATPSKGAGNVGGSVIVGQIFSVSVFEDWHP